MYRLIAFKEMGNYYSEEEVLEMGRQIIKNVPAADIIKISRERYPQLVSQALSGDKEAMMELFENFANKAAEFAEDGYAHEARTLFGTGVFRYDKTL